MQVRSAQKTGQSLHYERFASSLHINFDFLCICLFRVRAHFRFPLFLLAGSLPGLLCAADAVPRISKLCPAKLSPAQTRAAEGFELGTARRTAGAVSAATRNADSERAPAAQRRRPPASCRIISASVRADPPRAGVNECTRVSLFKFISGCTFWIISF